MRKQSGFSVIEIIMALVIISLIGAVAWQAVYGHKKSVTSPIPKNTPSADSPTPDPYAGWKTYDGAVFSARYPADWGHVEMHSAVTDEAFGTHVVYAQGGEVPNTSAFDVSLYSYGYDMGSGQHLQKDTDLVAFIRSANGLLSDSYFKYMTQQNRTIDGLAAIKLSGTVPGGPTFDTAWYVSTSLGVVSFQNLPGKGDVPQAQEQSLYNLFLNSIKFK